MTPVGALVFQNRILTARGTLFWVLTQKIALISGIAATTALAASIKVGMGPVPATLQTLAVLLSAVFFGPRVAVAGQIAYFLGGLAGIPWFAAGGGLAYLMSPTLGYIIGFIVATFIAGSICQRRGRENHIAIAGSMVLGNLAIYVFGLLGLLRYMPLETAWAIGVCPFIIGDALKIGAAATVLPLMQGFLRQRRF